MALPDREWYQIEDLANEWNISTNLLEHYLEINKLIASIKLPLTLLTYVEEYDVFDKYEKAANFNEFICDIEVTQENTDLMDGIFAISKYNFIRWDDNNCCDLYASNIYLYHHIDWKNITISKFAEPYTINKKELIIEKDSIIKFLTECNYDITNPSKLEQLDHSIIKTTTPPYLDRNNKFFSAELETAISAWLAIYGSDCFKENLAHKFQIKSWIEKNKKKEWGLSNEAIERITTLVNFDKRDGRLRKHPS